MLNRKQLCGAGVSAVEWQRGLLSETARYGFGGAAVVWPRAVCNANGNQLFCLCLGSNSDVGRVACGRQS
jgi:hypothetical protein